MTDSAPESSTQIAEFAPINEIFARERQAGRGSLGKTPSAVSVNSSKKRAPREESSSDTEEVETAQDDEEQPERDQDSDSGSPDVDEGYDEEHEDSVADETEEPNEDESESHDAVEEREDVEDHAETERHEEFEEPDESTRPSTSKVALPEPDEAEKARIRREREVRGSQWLASAAVQASQKAEIERARSHRVPEPRKETFDDALVSLHKFPKQLAENIMAQLEAAGVDPGSRTNGVAGFLMAYGDLTLDEIPEGVARSYRHFAHRDRILENHELQMQQGRDIQASIKHLNSRLDRMERGMTEIRMLTSFLAVERLTVIDTMGVNVSNLNFNLKDIRDMMSNVARQANIRFDEERRARGRSQG